MSVNVRRAAERAQPVFAANDWRWYGDPNCPPTVDEIEETIRRLVERVESVPAEIGVHPMSRTGRLAAERRFYDGDPRPETFVFLELGDSYDSEEASS